MVPAISEAVKHRVRLQTIQQKPARGQAVLAKHMNRRKNGVLSLRGPLAEPQGKEKKNHIPDKLLGARATA